jgi:hypothetical protein
MESTANPGLGFNNKYVFRIEQDSDADKPTTRKKDKDISIRVVYITKSQNDRTTDYRSINIVDNRKRDLYRQINQAIGG